MKKESSRFLLIHVSILLFVIVGISNTFAQSTITHQYQVSLPSDSSNRTAIVETSVSKELVSVSIQRLNEPTHYYNSYPQILVSAMRVGRNPLFTIYHDDQRIQAGQFDKKFSELSGVLRNKKKEIVSVKQQLEEDMQILRAIRAYDKNADVILAELAYTIVTYDSSILNSSDNIASKDFKVIEIEQTSKVILKKETADYKADKAEFARVFKAVSLKKQVGDDLNSCIQDAYNRFNGCQADAAITDKSICYNNRSSEVQTCYTVYGGKKKEPIQP